VCDGGGINEFVGDLLLDGYNAVVYSSNANCCKSSNSASLESIFYKQERMSD